MILKYNHQYKLKSAPKSHSTHRNPNKKHQPKLEWRQNKNSVQKTPKIRMAPLTEFRNKESKLKGAKSNTQEQTTTALSVCIKGQH